MDPLALGLVSLPLTTASNDSAVLSMRVDAGERCWVRSVGPQPLLLLFILPDLQTQLDVFVILPS